MNANNYTNWNLIRYSTLLSLLIFSNYFLWSINAWPIIKYINFFILFVTFVYFFVSIKFNEFWYLKIIILLLLLICLGTPTIPNDARNLFLFSAKILFYESNLYTYIDNYNHDSITLGLSEYSINQFLGFVFVKPKLASTLSATFAQLVGSWNEIFPKSTNVIIILPPIIFLISFFRDKVLILLWLFLMLFFSGKLFINGLMDGIISVYFVASILTIYKISITKIESEKQFLYFVMFLFFSILSLCKYEGGIMVLVILFSSIFVDLIYKRGINYKLLLTGIASLCPILFWKYIAIKNNMKMEFLQHGDPISRFLERIVNVEDLFIIVSFLGRNEKLIISLIIFIFFAVRYFKNNKKIILFISTNFLLYFSALITAVLLTPRTVLIQLEQSSTRIFIPLILMLIYFSIFLIKSDYPLDNNRLKSKEF